MVNYRRDKTKGGTYFFTLALQNRNACLLTKHIKLLGCSFRRAKMLHPFITKAILVLPEHLHLIMELPFDDANYSTRWRQIKTYFIQDLISIGEPISKNKRNEYNVWQRRFWEHKIRDETDFSAHVDYIHMNPVKHGLVTKALDWPYSSIHRYIRK